MNLGKNKMKRLLTRRGYERTFSKLGEMEKLLNEMTHRMSEVCSQSSETWHDNAPFDAIRDTAQQMEKQLKNLRGQMSNIEIMEYPRETNGTVRYGTKVTLERDGTPVTYIIVGYGDENSAFRRVVYEAPISQAIMGKKVDDEFTININNKPSRIKILGISPIADSDLV